jgi:putative transcriptional regulator
MRHIAFGFINNCLFVCVYADRAIREAIGMTQVKFAAAYEFCVRTVQEWERGAKRPSGPARTLLRAIKGDPEGLRKALAAV